MEAATTLAAGETTDLRSRTVVLDLDETLLSTNVLHELALVYLKQNPLRIFQLIGWLAKGRAHLKSRLSQTVTLDVDVLPANEAVIAYAEEQKRLGARVVLATATDSLIARRIARRFSFIDEVIGTENGVNLKGAEKARRLVALFPNGFTYVGDSQPDLKVWAVAKSAVVVTGSDSLVRRVEKITEIDLRVGIADAGKAMLRAMRLHQWAKNALVFAPLVLAGMAGSGAAWLQATLAFAALSVLASGTYILNDLFDLQADRQHWSKRNRPIAAGALPIGHALVLCGALVLAAIGLALAAGPAVLGLLAVYGALTVSYSMALKKQPITDAFVLATLFTLRLGIGVAAVGAMVSPWLLVFSMFLFGSLSLAKRYTELTRMAELDHAEANGRGYVVDDAPLVLALGMASGLGAIVIMVLYLINDAFLAGFYAEPVWLWSFPAILFLWIGRVWLVSHRGQLHDDPVAFAVRDRSSLIMGGFMALAFVAATTGLNF